MPERSGTDPSKRYARRTHFIRMRIERMRGSQHYRPGSRPTWLAGLALCATLYACVGDAASVADRAQRSVVLVVTERGAGNLGSGFFVGADVVVTNHHVVAGASQISVRTLDGREDHEVSVIAFDEAHDLSILRVSGIGAPPLALRRSRPSTGDRVFVLGHPEGLTFSFSEGVVAATRESEGVGFLQITAPISQGNSGGPVLDSRGRVIGVATATLSTGQNLNFAVQTIHISELLDRRAQSLASSGADGEEERPTIGYAFTSGETNVVRGQHVLGMYTATAQEISVPDHREALLVAYRVTEVVTSERDRSTGSRVALTWVLPGWAASMRARHNANPCHDIAHLRVEPCYHNPPFVEHKFEPIGTVLWERVDQEGFVQGGLGRVQVGIRENFTFEVDDNEVGVEFDMDFTMEGKIADRQVYPLVLVRVRNLRGGQSLEWPLEEGWIDSHNATKVSRMAFTKCNEENDVECTDIGDLREWEALVLGLAVTQVDMEERIQGGQSTREIEQVGDKGWMVVKQLQIRPDHPSQEALLVLGESLPGGLSQAGYGRRLVGPLLLEGTTTLADTVWVQRCGVLDVAGLSTGFSRCLNRAPREIGHLLPVGVLPVRTGR